MAKLKSPLLSFEAHGVLGDVLVYLPGGVQVMSDRNRKTPSVYLSLKAYLEIVLPRLLFRLTALLKVRKTITLILL